MRMHGLLRVLALVAAVTWARGADGDVALIRQKMDQAVASLVVGGLAPEADDAAYLRRVWIDLAGRTPPALVVRDFLDNKDPGKRARMVAQLLESENFADHWGRVLTVWLTSDRPVARDAYDGRVLHQFLRESLVKQEPYDRVVREVLTGSGASDASGPANFYLRYGADPPRLAGAVGKNLLGVTIQCAQCHDHPFAPWKESQFWGLAANFARVRKLEGDDDLKAVVEARRGELQRPDPAASERADDKNGATPEPEQVVVKPVLLSGKPTPDGNRRDALADWVVARDNPLFARNVVNRAWEQLFGKPLVPNLDDPASKADSLSVLRLLSEDFAGNGHDLRRLLRILVLSKSYGQAASAPAQPPWARPMVRPMSVDQLYASIAQATGHDGLADEADDAPDKDEEDPDADAAPDDDDRDRDDDDADRASEALGERALTLQRALVLLNGEFARDASRSAVRVSRAMNGHQTGASRIEWACLATLGRRPSEKELAIFRALLSEPNGLEDIYWILINSSEFQAIH